MKAGDQVIVIPKREFDAILACLFEGQRRDIHRDGHAVEATVGYLRDVIVLEVDE